jgi:hypothetical protein
MQSRAASAPRTALLLDVGITALHVVLLLLHDQQSERPAPRLRQQHTMPPADQLTGRWDNRRQFWLRCCTWGLSDTASLQQLLGTCAVAAEEQQLWTPVW